MPDDTRPDIDEIDETRETGASDPVDETDDAEGVDGTSETAMEADGHEDEKPEEVEEIPLSTDSERTQAIAEVLRHEEEKAEARRRARERMARLEAPRGIAPRHFAFVLVLVVTGYVWLGTPSWAQMAMPTRPTVELRDASLRLALYIQAQRIEEFRSARGRLPASLREAGPPLPGIRYTATPRDTYHLIGTNEDLTLFYSSSLTLSREAFLGEAETTVFTGGGP